ncbi:PfkB family carbohydrate kinase [Jiella sp. MQZ9-1]|nr:PfkB family carbohydrate kinase [Jiella flava]
MDYVYRVPRLPERAAEVMATSFERLPGGAVNMMVAARRTGLATACGGFLGTGPDGDALRRFLTAEAIDVLLPPLCGVDCGNCVVLITPDAERSFVSFPGAEARMADLSALHAELRPGDFLAVSGYVLAYPGSRDGVLALIETLSPGIAVVFDPAPVIADIPVAILDRMLARTTWLSANLHEIRAIIRAEASPELVSALLNGRMAGGQGIVLRNGETGAHLILRGEIPEAVPGFAVEAIDTNGAGDTHVGAFVSALARGARPGEAVRYANAASAIAVTRRGGASGPTHDEIIRFLSLASTASARKSGSIFGKPGA